MINIDFKKEKGKIDEIINEALADYQNEIDLISIDDWTLKSKELFIDRSYNAYSSQSTQFINTSFPDISSLVDSNARLILYLYASERDFEFDLIKKLLVAKIKKSK
ncbi:hypothetical protein [Flavobacterium bizetiae]|uniref:hypothetical protein n=2 Tax=Flavobacterium bizetiae TaxID=2704140 RepID=UPI001748D928|nr:hypothetical protein [Flavobacterium bizetiae]CAD5342644.1 hypothetical protein FLA105535_02633 [Flavobacterium bizetiae]CAD5349961.1 hypothetical protein FLA105534_03948 [Flavobacterium bizetiae]